MPPVAPVTDPFKLIALLFAQTDALAPAFTTGAGVKVITRFAETGLQLPLPVLVKVSVNVPKGTSSGQALRLKGKGVRNAGSAAAGDQIITVRIVLPDKIDESLAYFLAEWRKKNAYDPGRP